MNYLAQTHPSSDYQVNTQRAAMPDELNMRLEKLLSTEKVPVFKHRHFIDLPMLQYGQLQKKFNLPEERGHDDVNWKTHLNS